MSYFNIVMEDEVSTVVSRYTPEKRTADGYQSEAELEKDFIERLTRLGYGYITIHTEKELVANLRRQIERLNDYTFTEEEWERLFKNFIANSNEGIVEKTRTIQEDHIKTIRLDNGMSKNITLIDKKNIHNNSLQVMNQYRTDTGSRKNRYDVTILVNGLPLIHIELKRRGVALREAFNQIDRYQYESFWSGSGLFEYVQIFVISNGTNTKYYSNTTRFNIVREGKQKKTRTSNSFEFTNFWADADNVIIPDLVDFTRTFFAKHTILNILTKYCVFTSENMLLVMRPYQIVATERILNRIEVANNYKKYGSVEGGGYVWHTTGSGKTLTSFKAAKLASKLPYIDKVLFVVDRKDLDYQTMREYDRFEKGAANSNSSTTVLKRQLEDPDCNIIITTIQKLATFIKKNATHDVYNSRIVIIFDECHRSQFGDMHVAITKKFKKYHIFGFTGTPIFEENADLNKNPNLCTTAQAFGDLLHTYTIVDAISDKNVLPFRVDYIRTIRRGKEIEDIEVVDINRESAFLAEKRISLVTGYILEHFAQKTYRNEQTGGFNSIFAVSSVEAAMLYYREFMKQMDENEENDEGNKKKRLKIAVIYSYSSNGEDEENPEDTSGLDKNSRQFLDYAIDIYNKEFGTNYDTSGDKFQSYYKDVSLRMKNREIDLLIVVNMFLTGFDATTLNTLWVDKNLKMHGLIQAYSRTNRIYNSVKTFGNIVCFRNLKSRTDEAVARFGNKDAGGIITLRSFDDYYNGYADGENHVDGYVDMISSLLAGFPLSEPAIVGDERKKTFISLIGAILRMRNLLSSFDEFEGNELISELDFQDYLSRYQDLRDEIAEMRRNGSSELENIDDDIIFEVELLKQIEMNIDYILMLVAQYKKSSCFDEKIRISIQKAVDSSPELRSKRDLINKFIAGINNVDDVVAAWHSFVSVEREKALSAIIKDEKMNEELTRNFMTGAFRDGAIRTTGTEIDKIIPASSRFGGNRKEKKEKIINKLTNFFEKFWNIS